MTECNKSTTMTTNPSNPMSNAELLHLPFIEVFKTFIKEAVRECMTEFYGTQTMTQTQAQTTPESLDAAGALAFLNANGYPISKGQLYKETSNGTIPYQKFGNKLHFKASQLIEWAERRLIDGNAIGVLQPAVNTMKKGGSR